MKQFRDFLKEQMLNEAPVPAPGGLATPAGLPPGGPPSGMGGPPGMGGTPPPIGGGGPPPPMGGPPSMGGPPGGGQQGPAMKLKSPDVWSVLAKHLGIED